MMRIVSADFSVADMYPAFSRKEPGPNLRNQIVYGFAIHPESELIAVDVLADGEAFRVVEGAPLVFERGRTFEQVEITTADLPETGRARLVVAESPLEATCLPTVPRVNRRRRHRITGWLDDTPGSDFLAVDFIIFRLPRERALTAGYIHGFRFANIGVSIGANSTLIHRITPLYWDGTAYSEWSSAPLSSVDLSATAKGLAPQVEIGAPALSASDALAGEAYASVVAYQRPDALDAPPGLLRFDVDFAIG